MFETLLAQGGWCRAVATRIYASARPSYHAVTRGTVDEALGRQGG